MKAYEHISEERLTSLIKEFLDWSGGDTPEHNIWDSTDAEDDDVPKVYYFCEGLTDENEKELIEDWQDETVIDESPVFFEKLKNIVRELQAGWQYQTYE